VGLLHVFQSNIINLCAYSIDDSSDFSIYSKYCGNLQVDRSPHPFPC